MKSKAGKILITGSSGMLGVDLCQELMGDYKIIGTDLVTGNKKHVTSFYQGDITDKKNISGIIAKVKPDIVIHTAAWTDVDACELDGKRAYKINSEGTRNIAHACKKTGSVPIYISTDFVFDGKRKRPYKEEDRPDPINIYADSKLKGENFIRRLLKKYFIIRTGWLYGRNGKNFVDTILAKAKKEKILKIVDDQVGSPTYTKDISRAIHALLDNFFLLSAKRYPLNAKYGIYHISNAGSVSWYAYAKAILRLAKSKTRTIPISSGELARPARRPAMSVLDSSKFIKFTGYRMRGWEDALREYLLPKQRRWYVE